MLASLALKSLRARKVTVGLTVLSITISVFVLLAIYHIKSETKTNFTSTVSGVDLIVGARTGQINLLLYSVFRVGNATSNISWEAFQRLAEAREVAWVVPISLGDSHLGYRVMGTDENYFKHFSYGNKRKLSFDAGEPFASTFDVVMGAGVAKALGYDLGDSITLSHGIGSTSFTEHKNPFTIVGILAPTGTPVDQTVHVRLDGLEAVHVGWQTGVDLSGVQSTQTPAVTDLTPASITAFMVGLNSKLSTFSFQRKVNTFESEALSAILPGVALTELWRLMGAVENILLVISWLVLGSALIGMATMMLASMRERRREFAVLRAIGARPFFITLLVQLEAVLTVVFSVLLAGLLLVGVLAALQGWLVGAVGVHISFNIVAAHTLTPVGLILACAVIVGVLPAVAAYRTSAG